MIVVATILALTGALTAFFIWKPLVRRVVLRNIARRPREAALVVAGSIFGTAMLTGVLVVGDSVQQSMRAAAAHRLGPVDEIAVVNDTTVADDIARNLAIMQPAGVDGAMVIETGEVLVRAGDRFVGRAGVLAFDQDPAAVLPDAATLRPPDGEVIVTDDLAARLDVRPGESVRIGSGEPMRIAAVVPPRGVAGFTLRPAADTLNVVMSRATYSRVVDFGAANGAVLVAISNTGGALDGARNTELATASVYGAGGTYVAALQPVRVEALAAAQAEGDALGQLLLVGALLGVIAGLLLLAGIFVMLADDRTAELGLLQALGMRRRTTIAVFVAEGACYALPAAVLGIGTGVALAALLLRTMNGWFSSGWRGESVHAQLHLTSRALESGLLLGFAAALLAVSLTAWRIARRSIATAQRGGAVDHAFLRVAACRCLAAHRGDRRAALRLDGDLGAPGRDDAVRARRMPRMYAVARRAVEITAPRVRGHGCVRDRSRSRGDAVHACAQHRRATTVAGPAGHHRRGSRGRRSPCGKCRSVAHSLGSDGARFRCGLRSRTPERIRAEPASTSACSPW